MDDNVKNKRSQDSSGGKTSRFMLRGKVRKRLVQKE